MFSSMIAHKILHNSSRTGSHLTGPSLQRIASVEYRLKESLCAVLLDNKCLPSCHNDVFFSSTSTVPEQCAWNVQFGVCPKILSRRTLFCLQTSQYDRRPDHAWPASEALSKITAHHVGGMNCVTDHVRLVFMASRMCKRTLIYGRISHFNRTCELYQREWINFLTRSRMVNKDCHHKSLINKTMNFV